MTHDDELRRRMNRLADGADLGTVTLESVQARGHRRTQRQRIFAVAAAFVFVAGAAFTLQTLTDRQGDTDVAAPADDTADSATADQSDDDAARDGDAETPEADGDAISSTTLAPDAAFTESAAVEGFDHGYYGDSRQVVAWKGGFLAWGQRHVPSDASLADLVPDLADRFPPEVVEAMRDAGIEDGDLLTADQLMMLMEEGGLYEVVEETFMGDPELRDAFSEVMSGGTFEPFVEVSSDGTNWSPVEVDLLLAEDSWPQVASNGDALVLTVQNRTWDEQTGRTIDQQITVHTTTDLETWHSHTVPVDVEPSSPFASVDSYPTSVAAGPDGWYLAVNVHSWVDVYAGLPAPYVQEMDTNGWGYEIRDDGIALVSYPDESEFSEPDDHWTEEEWIAWEESWAPTVERLIPWAELPFDQADVYGPSEGMSFGFVGDYAGSMTRAVIPPVDTAECCQVTATDAGFLALVWDYSEHEGGFGYPTVAPAAYPTVVPTTIAPDPAVDAAVPVYEGPTVSLWFSTDGQTWVERSIPDSQWFDSVAAVQDSVLLLGSSEDGQTMWRGGADGTGWELADRPDVGEDRYLWFHSSGPEGVASVVDVAVYDYAEFVAYAVEFTVDGKDLALSVSESGEQRLVVSEGGAVLVDRSGQLYEDEVWQYGEDGFEVHDDEGNVIVVVDWETAETTIYPAESEAWQAREESDPYVPEYVLIATVDGRTWFRQDLPSSPDAWYEVAAISNGIVTVSSGGEWTTFAVG